MSRFVSAAFKSLGSIFAPGMLGVFISSVIFTLFALIGFVILATIVGSALSGYVSDPEMSHFLPYISGFGAAAIAYFLFPGIMPVIVNFFDSKIARLIETEDYPNAHPIDPPFWPELIHDLRFSLTAIALNILVLPIYIFLPFIGLLIFYVLNGHLLGKEFFVMVARRYMSIPDALALRKTNSRIVFVGGLSLALLATIPFLNLFAPFWGIAVMIHLYHSLGSVTKVEILAP